MSKLSSTVKVGALCLSLMGLSAATVEPVNTHYFGNKLLLMKEGNKYTASGIIGGEMTIDGGYFTSTINGKQLIAFAIPKRNGYLVKALYRQNGKNSQFFDQMVATNAWSHAQNGVMAKVYSYDWSQCFWQSAQNFTYQLRAEI